MNASGGDGKDGTDGGGVVVREEGVEVEKSHETDRFPVPAVVFAIRSERSERVEVRLADRVPEGVSMDDIGFHPEYGSDFWSVEGRTLVFERELESESETETVYGLRGPNAEAADRFLGDPTVEVWTGGESDSSFVEDINDQLTRSATFADGENGERDVAMVEETAGSSDVFAGGEQNESEAADGTGATIEAGESDESGVDDDRDESSKPEEVERTEEDERAGDERDGRGDDGERDEGGKRGESGATVMDDTMDENTPIDTETDGTSTADETTGTIATRLARELRAGRVDADDRETLRDALGPRESVGARIDHLRSQVNDVAAYADALEAFLDENGSGRTLIRRQSDRLDALREDVEASTERASANRADIDAIESSVASVEGDVEGIESEVETIEGDVDAFQTAISDLDEEIERIDERFANIDERLGGVEDHQEAIDERLDALEASHESDIDDLREDLEEHVDERVTDVERSTESIEADVESIEAWRTQLAGALGGTEGTGGDGESDSPS